MKNNAQIKKKKGYTTVDNDIFYETSKAVSIYAESSLAVIRSMEKLESIDSFMISESTSDNKKSDIASKIYDTIKNIFKKLSQLLTKGKTQTKAQTQKKAIESIKDDVDPVSKTKVKIQDVWSYYKFASSTIDQFIAHPNSRTFKVMLKKKKEKIAIDELTYSLHMISKEMKTPSVRQFKISEFNYNTAVNGLIATKYGTKLAIKANTAANTQIQNAIANKYRKRMSKLGERSYETYDPETDELYFDKESLKQDIKDESKKYVNNAKKQDERHSIIYKCINLAVYIEIAASFFAAAPKRSGVETITVGELQKRLESLNAEKLPAKVDSIGNSMSTFLTRSEALKEFADNSASVKFAEKVSKLLSAYTEFYQSMIDFYYSIIKSVIRAGGVNNSKRIYSPDMILKAKADLL